MKKAIFFGPGAAAIFFTIPESWQLMNQPNNNYVPVIFELMLLLLGYLVALVINLALILPLGFLLQIRTLNPLAGFGLAFFIALMGTTVAYAFEIFGYHDSILAPEYLYPLFVPLLLLSLMTQYYLRLRKLPRPASPPPQPEHTKDEEDH